MAYLLVFGKHLSINGLDQKTFKRNLQLITIKTYEVKLNKKAEKFLSFKTSLTQTVSVLLLHHRL